ncbi:MAG: right-handed parallel beta-helix repeat-containing protein [bacterium]|nr:right-handed parallel beta-helix repeat-containing protein [bacterium]
MSLSTASETPAEESISVVRIKDDLMVKWLCPGLQKTSLFVLNGDEQWEAMDSAYTVDVETQYYSVNPLRREGFFRTTQEQLGEFPRLRIMAPSGFFAEWATPVRVEVLRPDGQLDSDAWEGEVSLRFGGDSIWSYTTSLPLHNGIASGLISSSVGGLLTASYEGESAEKRLIPIQVLGGFGITVAGVLPDPVTIWKPGDGIVRVTGDVTVPAGSTLRIYPDTIIRLDPKKSITVHGTIECLGTVEHPVLFAAADPENPWGQIHHDHPSTKSTYKGTFFIGGGDSSGAGHTERGPVIRVSSAQIDFDYCNVMDNYGKGLYAGGGDLTFNHCHFSRSAMGMEVVNVNIAIDRCSFTMMPMGGDVADNDPLYLNGSGNMSVTNSIFAIGGDDGIDTLSSTPLIENCVIHGFLDKGISVYFGAPHINNCLILDNDYGISAKGDGTDVYVDRTTIVKNRVNIQSRNKYNEPNAIIKYYVTNCILWEHTSAAVQTDYPLEDISITYSCVQGAEPFPGEGNINDDPRFVGPTTNDFRLQNDSPCLGSGKDGADMGFTYPDSP